jgi:hypothetical protein
MKTRTTLVLALFAWVLGACSDDVPLGGNDDAGTGGSGGTAGSGGECTVASECAVIEMCMQCTDGTSVCPKAECVNGQCEMTYPPCTAPECSADNDCPMVGAPCQTCPDGSTACPGVTCRNGRCEYVFESCGGYDACADKRCGEECSLCDPQDPNCVAPAVMMYCDKLGQCGTTFPVCGGEACTSDEQCPTLGAPCSVCPDGTTSCPTSVCVANQCEVFFPPCGAYDPCEGKLCGQECTICDPLDPTCVGPAVMMYCDQVGTCGMQFPVCSGGQCKSDNDCPQIGAPCSPCPDGTQSCPTVSCVSEVCTYGWSGCSGYDPCEGKACGETCTLCSPNDPNCAETGVLKFCGATGSCGMAFPLCP